MAIWLLFYRRHVHLLCLRRHIRRYIRTLGVVGNRFGSLASFTVVTIVRT
jgi:hypothetical protein